MPYKDFEKRRELVRKWRAKKKAQGLSWETPVETPETPRDNSRDIPSVDHKIPPMPPEDVIPEVTPETPETPASVIPGQETLRETPETLRTFSRPVLINTELWRLIEPKLEQVERVSQSEYKALCIFHAEEHPSLYTDIDKGCYYCFGCGAKGTLWQLAKELGVLPNNGRISADEAMTNLLVGRMVSFETQEHFGIEIDEEQQAYKYPANGGHRFKSFSPNANSKYWNTPGIKNQLYGTALPGNVIYLLNGEPAVWAAWQDELPALCTFGEGNFPKEGIEQLKALKPGEIIVLPDNDEEGIEYGKKRKELLQDAGFKVKLLKPFGLGEHADFADLHTSLNADKEAIRVALEEQEEMPDEDLEKLYEEQGLRPLEEILAECRGVKWIWDGLLREGTINIMAAKPKVGKSNTLLNLAIEVSKGANFLGREAMRLSVVYYCVDEDPESINDRIKGRPYGDIRFTFTGPPLDSVLKLMQKKGQAFYVIDTLQRFLGIKDINDYSEVTNLLAPMQVKARETGSAVIFTHHGRKMEMEESKGDITLGSTALFGGVDTLLMMRIKDGERVICSSQRIGESLEETIVELDKDSGEMSVGGTLEEKLIRKAQEEIERILEGGRSLRTEEIKEEFKGDNTRLRKALRGMEEESKLSTEGKGKKGDPKRYYLK